MPIRYKSATKRVKGTISHRGDKAQIQFHGFGHITTIYKTHFGELMWSRTLDPPLEVVPGQTIKFNSQGWDLVIPQ